MLSLIWKTCGFQCVKTTDLIKRTKKVVTHFIKKSQNNQKKVMYGKMMTE